MLLTDAHIETEIPAPKSWTPSTDDWYALRKQAELAGCDMLEFETFVNANKGKGLGPAGIYNRTADMFLNGGKNEPDNYDTGKDLDAAFNDALVGDD
jgi:hypothetical protein